MLKEFCITMFFPPDFDLHAHTESLIITEVTDSLDCVSFKWLSVKSEHDRLLEI